MNDETEWSEAEITFINPIQFQDKSLNKVIEKTLDNTVDEVVNEAVNQVAEKKVNEQADDVNFVFFKQKTNKDLTCTCLKTIQ